MEITSGWGKLVEHYFEVLLLNRYYYTVVGLVLNPSSAYYRNPSPTVGS